MFIGVPDRDSALIALPGKRMVSEGKGNLAYFSALYGSLTGIMITVLLAVPLMWFLSSLFSIIEIIKPFIITVLLLNIVLDSGDVRKALAVCGICGTLGYVMFNLDSVSTSSSFLPVFTGLFGVPVLLRRFKTGIIRHSKEIIPPDSKNIKGGITGSFAGLRHQQQRHN